MSRRRETVVNIFSKHRKKTKTRQASEIDFRRGARRLSATEFLLLANVRADVSPTHRISDFHRERKAKRRAERIDRNAAQGDAARDLIKLRALPSGGWP